MARKPTKEEVVARARQAAAHAQQGNLENAVAILIPLLPSARELPAVLDLYADIRGRQGHYTEAASYYHQVLKTHRDAIDIRQKLSMCLYRTGRFDEAIQQIERIRENDPWNAVAVLSLVETYSSMGMKDAAVALLDELESNIDSTARNSTIAARMTVTRLRLSDDEAVASKALDTAESDTSLTEAIRASLATHAGLVFQKKNRHDEAFEALATAKTIRGLAYDASDHESRITQAIDYWNSDEAHDLPKSGIDGSKFVFIVGMPRSGTSLLEQMLGRLGGVAPLGERSEIMRLAAGICTPPSRAHQAIMTHTGRYSKDNIDAIMPTIMQAYDDAALGYASEPSDRNIYTDKQVYNFLHLPLIARVLPGARVIHIRRNPCDNAMSCFSQWFNHQHQFTKDMASLGHYYRQYRQLVDAYRKLPAPTERPEMIDVVYEQLVREPEATIRPIVDFLGLEYNDAVLSPNKSERVVMTVSRDQVRNPINTKAVGRWRAYEHHMQPFIEAIGPELAAEIEA